MSEFNFEKYLIGIGYEETGRNEACSVFGKEDIKLYIAYRDKDIELAIESDGTELSVNYIPIPATELQANVLILEMIPRATGVLKTIHSEFNKLNQ